MPPSEVIDLCSSDVEFEPPSPEKYANAGQATIESMKEMAEEDRMSSKKATKQLKFELGQPKQQYQRILWFNRFKGFRAYTLKKE
jgi:hypothetical protein